MSQDTATIFDLKKFFDNIAQRLLIPAVGKHAREKWMNQQLVSEP
jgi:hypothetical protein